MKDVRQNMDSFEARQQTTNPRSEASAKKEPNPASKGDYIDFEEVK